MPLARRLSMLAEYFNDRYDFDGATLLPTGLANSFARRGARGRINLLLARQLVTYGEYINYRYSFGSSTTLPDGFPPSINRQEPQTGRQPADRMAT